MYVPTPLIGSVWLGVPHGHVEESRGEEDGEWRRGRVWACLPLSPQEATPLTP